MNNKQIVKDAYSIIAQAYFDQFFINEEDLKYYEKFSNIAEKGLLIDAGCGNGSASYIMGKKGFDCIGYDLSEEMIALGKKHYPTLNIHVQDIEFLPKLNEKAKSAIYAYSLPSLTLQQSTNSLLSCNKNLIMGAKLMLLLHKGEGKKYIDEPLASGTKNFVKYYNETEITQLLNKCGFKVDSIDLDKELADNAQGDIIMCVIATKVEDK